MLVSYNGHQVRVRAWGIVAVYREAFRGPPDLKTKGSPRFNLYRPTRGFVRSCSIPRMKLGGAGAHGRARGDDGIE